MNNPQVQPYFLLAVLVLVFALSFFIFRPFLAPLSLAVVFAVAFYPFYTKVLSNVGGERRGLAAIIASITIILCIFIPLALLGTQIFNEARDLYVSFSSGSGKIYLDAAAGFFSDITGKFLPGVGINAPLANISASIDTYAKEGLEWLIRNLGNAFSGIAVFLADLVIFFIALYYLLRDGEKFKRALISLSPFADTDDEGVFKNLGLAVNSIFKGSFVVALVQGVIAAVGFIIFGVPNAVLWGTMAAVAALVPGAGTALVILPGALFLFLTGSTGAAIGLLFWGALAVGLVDNFLGPKLLGRGMNLHPLLVLLSVLGGIGFFGFTGLFLGPLTLSLLFALLSIYSSRRTAR